MMERVAQQPAYLLHSRPYRDSSRICEFFTRDYGRVAGVVRGVRAAGARRRSSQAALQPFVPLSVSWSGRSELKSVNAVDSSGAFTLQRERLYSGLYVNEITERLLHRNDAHGELFAAYELCLSALAGDSSVAPLLRRYELALLEELGYGMSVSMDADTGAEVEADAFYAFYPEVGLRRNTAPAKAAALPGFKGADLLDMAAGNWHADSLRCAKALCRAALQPLLGDKPLRSRDLFKQLSVAEA